MDSFIRKPGFGCEDFCCSTYNLQKRDIEGKDFMAQKKSCQKMTGPVS